MIVKSSRLISVIDNFSYSYFAMVKSIFGFAIGISFPSRSFKNIEDHIWCYPSIVTAIPPQWSSGHSNILQICLCSHRVTQLGDYSCIQNSGRLSIVLFCQALYMHIGLFEIWQQPLWSIVQQRLLGILLQCSPWIPASSHFVWHYWKSQRQVVNFLSVKSFISPINFFISPESFPVNLWPADTNNCTPPFHSNIFCSLYRTLRCMWTP